MGRFADDIVQAWTNCAIKVKYFGAYRRKPSEPSAHRRRDHYSLLFNLGHRCRLHQGGTDVVLEDGDACLLPPGFGFSHAIDGPRRDGITYRMDFYLVRGTGMPDPLSRLPLPGVVRPEATDELRAAAEAVLACFPGWRSRQPEDVFTYRPDAERLLAPVVRALIEAAEATGHEPAIPPWLADLHEWLSSAFKQHDLDIAACARRCGFSPSQVAHAFSRHYGIAPMAFVRERRLALACRMLEEQPETAVADIARRCGFAGSSHFSRRFRQAFGKTPSQWRKPGRD